MDGEGGGVTRKMDEDARGKFANIQMKARVKTVGGEKV